MLTVAPQPGGVLLLTMDDGKVNAIGPAFLDAFEKQWPGIAAQRKAVVLASDARAFCAGLDLKALQTMEKSEMTSFVARFMRMVHGLWTYPAPVVAVVEGAAPAGGSVLALCADLRLVTEGARMGLQEVAVGIRFPPPVLEMARHLLPPQEHAPALLQGRPREGGAACVEGGWAHRLLPTREAARWAAIAEAAQMASLNPQALAAAKQQLRAPVTALTSAFDAARTAEWVGHLLAPETQAAIARSLAARGRKA